MVLALLVYLAAPLNAAELSGSLSKDEIRETVKVIGWGTSHRGFGAHGISNEGLGLDVGFEAPFFLSHDIDSLGDKRGIVPGVVPVPRLWASWDFPGGFQGTTSFSPGSLYGGITVFGLGGQWNFYKQDRITASAVLTYTYANAFGGDLKTHSPGLKVQISKDLELWQPFASVGFLSANGTVNETLTDAGVDNGPYTAPATHVSAGFRLDMMAQLVFQVDLIGTRPSMGFLFSHRF